MFIQLDQAFADFDQAFRLDPRTQREEFLKRLDASLQQFKKAQFLARGNARTFAEVVDNVSDLGVLWRLNTYGVQGTEQVAKFMENIDDYHHGKPYLNPVGWDKVFLQFPPPHAGVLTTIITASPTTIRGRAIYRDKIAIQVASADHLCRFEVADLLVEECRNIAEGEAAKMMARAKQK